MKARWFMLILCLFLLGCSTHPTTPDYYSVSASSTTSGYTASYAVTTVNSAVVSGYKVTQTLPTLTFSLASRLRESYLSATLPKVTFTSMSITYTVAGDTTGNLGTWKPAARTVGTSIIIPQSSSVESTASITMADIASNALADEVFVKIGSVAATATGSGTFAFNIALSTGLTLKADAVLTGTDENGLTVTLPFSTTIYFKTTTS